MSDYILPDTAPLPLKRLFLRLRGDFETLQKEHSFVSAKMVELDAEMHALCSVAEGSKYGASHEEALADCRAPKTQKRPSIPAMIFTILEEHREFGLEAKLIADCVLQKWDLELPWKRVAGECRRLFNEGRLLQDDDSRRYRISDL